MQKNQRSAENRWKTIPNPSKATALIGESSTFDLKMRASVIIILVICLSGSFAQSSNSVADAVANRKTLANPQETAKLMDDTSDPSYPSLVKIPLTTFSCSSVNGSGLYADVSTKCQVFHQCQANGRKYSYLCQAGSAFNQMSLACDYFYNVACESSPKLYDFSNQRDKLDSEAFDKCYKSCSKDKCPA